MDTNAFGRLRERKAELTGIGEGLRPALDVWAAYVQSRPEVGKAILALGKRDISPDEPPVALRCFRPDSGMIVPLDVSPPHKVIGLNDQHCYLSVPNGSPLKVGDMVAFAISHPCLTFDKWRVIRLIDKNYCVTRSVRTYV